MTVGYLLSAAGFAAQVWRDGLGRYMPHHQRHDHVFIERVIAVDNEDNHCILLGRACFVWLTLVNRHEPVQISDTFSSSSESEYTNTYTMQSKSKWIVADRDEVKSTRLLDVIEGMDLPGEMPCSLFGSPVQTGSITDPSRINFFRNIADEVNKLMIDWKHEFTEASGYSQEAESPVQVEADHTEGATDSGTQYLRLDDLTVPGVNHVSTHSDSESEETDAPSMPSNMGDSHADFSSLGTPVASHYVKAGPKFTSSNFLITHGCTLDYPDLSIRVLITPLFRAQVSRTNHQTPPVQLVSGWLKGALPEKYSEMLPPDTNDVLRNNTILLDNFPFRVVPSPTACSEFASTVDPNSLSLLMNRVALRYRLGKQPRSKRTDVLSIRSLDERYGVEFRIQPDYNVTVHSVQCREFMRLASQLSVETKCMIETAVHFDSKLNKPKMSLFPDTLHLRALCRMLREDRTPVRDWADD